MKLCWKQKIFGQNVLFPPSQVLKAKLVISFKKNSLWIILSNVVALFFLKIQEERDKQQGIAFDKKFALEVKEVKIITKWSKTYNYMSYNSGFVLCKFVLTYDGLEYRHILLLPNR